ncbi:MAG: NAD(P)-dependent oxidoreductase [Verrucomicrobia bacterium]|nr:NAD(P)-dependent oxidoreductase [Verrucomicrobiota bacterium]
MVEGPPIKLLITGAAGKIGTRLCTALAEAGHTVSATDILPAPSSPIPITTCDMLDRAAVAQCVAGHDAVLHLAGHSKPNGEPDPVRLHLENIAMTAHVIEAVIGAGVPKLIFASSIHAIIGALYTSGNLALAPPALPLDGDTAPRPRSLYGLSKQVGEEMLRQAADQHTLEAVALRLPYCVESVAWARERLRLDPTEPLRDGLVAALTYRELASLVDAILRTPLPGYRCYFPSHHRNALDAPLSALLPYLAHLPHKQAAPLQFLVDTSRITRETGWSPER